MGAFYTNITLRGPQQAEIVHFLRRSGQAAWVTPTVRGVTVVYDRESARHIPDVLRTLARDLSDAFGCVALAVSLYDSDILQYELFQAGERLDGYDSAPGYWRDDLDAANPPSGGDAWTLCEAFGATAAVPRVHQILEAYDPTPFDAQEAGDDDEDPYVFEEDRHADLARAIGLPTYVVCAGFQRFEEGDVPEGLDRSTMVRT